jgi:hypothetical protein
VKDAMGCTSTSAPITIIGGSNPIVSLTATVTQSGQVTCNGGTATLTVNATGGTAPYTYSLNGAAYVSSNVFSNLTGGVYTITVKDATGAIYTAASVTVNASVSITATATLNGQIMCNGGTTSITVSAAAGGTAPYTYSINGGAFVSSNVFSSLAAGVYTITVKDANGCMGTLSAVTVNAAPAAITVTATASAVTNGVATVTATATGGTAAYEYSINGGTTYVSSNVFAGIAVGASVTITVKDAMGCTSTSAPITITGGGVVTPVTPGTLTATATINGQILCYGGMTSITVNATGGTAPYTYNMNGGAYVTSNVFSGLTAGMYVVSVKDANGEMFYASCITVNAAPSTIKISSLTVGACVNGMAAVTATATGGTGALQYSIDGGVTYQNTGAFTGIASGTSVTITVKDANGCTTTSPMMMVNCGTSSSIVVNVTSGDCLNSSTTLTATATGGVAPYTYSLDGGAFVSAGVFAGVVSGNHTINVKDANGGTGTYNALLSLNCGACPPGSYTATAALNGQILCNGETTSLTATATGGVAPYTYSLNGGTFVSSNLFSGLTAGSYVITVKDANGTAATAASVTVAAAPAAITVNAAAGTV